MSSGTLEDRLAALERAIAELTRGEGEFAAPSFVQIAPDGSIVFALQGNLTVPEKPHLPTGKPSSTYIIGWQNPAGSITEFFWGAANLGGEIIAGIGDPDAPTRTVRIIAGDGSSDFEQRIAKDVANGYAGLDATTKVIAAELGTGTPGVTNVLRGDRSWAQVDSAMIADGSIGDGDLRQSAGNTVIGRSSAVAGPVADIQSTVDGDLLMHKGTTLSWGLLANANIAANAAIAQSKLALTGAVFKDVLALLNGTTSYTPASGVSYLVVECIGGGGGGGGAAATAAGQLTAAGGGGGGGYAWTFTNVNVVGAHTVAIGAGGGGGVGGVAGGGGGTTDYKNTLASSVCTAGGGTGGEGGAAVAAANMFNGGNGGAGSIGQTLAAGQPGGWSCIPSLAVMIAGDGGCSYISGGANNPGKVASANGVAAQANGGGGGSGASNGASQVARTGGAGATGLMRIWEFNG
jgi:hypothetical protein